MTIYIAVVAVCLNMCQFAYTSDGFDTKEKCVTFIKEAIKDFDKPTLMNSYALCIPVTVPKYI
jgi:hypothetical protein